MTQEEYDGYLKGLKTALSIVRAREPSYGWGDNDEYHEGRLAMWDDILTDVSSEINAREAANR